MSAASDESGAADSRAGSIRRLVGMRVCVAGVQVGRISEVLFGDPPRQVLALVISDRGAQRGVLPWPAAEVGPECVASRSSQALLPMSALAFYMDHGARLDDRG
jgi:hypothetical protein